MLNLFAVAVIIISIISLILVNGVIIDVVCATSATS